MQPEPSSATASCLSDRDLLDAIERVVADERHRTADLLALLGELDARRLYLAQSCASLFMFCTQVLHYSEHAAYHRIEAARAARQFPVILGMVAAGALTLTSVALLRPHLTRDNHGSLLEAARHKSKREVEQQVACLAPRPDQPSVVRRLPTPMSVPAPTPTPAPKGTATPAWAPTVAATPTRQTSAEPPPAPDLPPKARATPAFQPFPRARLEPTSSERYLLKVTLSADAYANLRRAQDLIRHSCPDGDLALVIDRALTVLVQQLERIRFARLTARAVPRATKHPSSRSHRRSRYIPAAVRREVWRRDGGRCAFVGGRGRCGETGRLEFHHLVPFADGGVTSVENLALRCQAHNGHEVELWSPTRIEGSAGRSAQ